MENSNKNKEVSFPMSSLREIPEPKSDAKKIVALIKDEGRVSGYKLSDGRAVTREEGVSLARQGEISGVGISSRKGTEYLKSIPDGAEGNNLSNLPSVTEASLRG